MPVLSASLTIGCINHFLAGEDVHLYAAILFLSGSSGVGSYGAIFSISLYGKNLGSIETAGQKLVLYGFGTLEGKLLILGTALFGSAVLPALIVCVTVDGQCKSCIFCTQVADKFGQIGSSGRAECSLAGLEEKAGRESSFNVGSTLGIC